MSFLRLGFMSLKRRKARTALTVTGVALAVALLVSLQGFNAGYEQALNENVDRIGYHVLVTAKGCPYEAATLMLKGGTGLRYIRQGIADKLAADPRVKTVSRQLIQPYFDVEGGSQSFYMGVEEAFLVTRPTFAEGGFFSNQQAAEAVMGWEAAELEQRHVGDEILIPDERLPIEKRVLKVVGILERVGNQTDGTVFVPLARLQDLSGHPGKLTGVGVVLTEEAVMEVDKYENDLNADPALGEAQVVGMKAARNAIIGLLQNARSLILAVSMIALLVAVIGIMNTMMMSVFERTPQIGVMKALGASSVDVFRIIVWETLLISAVAGLAGGLLALLGSGLVALLVRLILPFAPTGDLIAIGPDIMIQAALGVIGVGLLAAILPAAKAARMDPIRAIRAGE